MRRRIGVVVGAALFAACVPPAANATPSPSAAAVAGVAMVRTFHEPLPLTGESDIKPGPDGNIWFTAIGEASAIGRITPAGKVTTFQVPPTSYGYVEPESIAAGLDGDLWVGQY